MLGRLQQLQSQLRARQLHQQQRPARPERSLPWTRRNLRNRSSFPAHNPRGLSSGIVNRLHPFADAAPPRDESPNDNNRHVLDSFMSANARIQDQLPATSVNMRPPNGDTHRIQRIDLFKAFPSVIRRNENVVVRRCVLHNDSTAEISQDGRLLTTFIRNNRNGHDDTIVGVFSLEAGRVGHLLYTKSFGLFSHSQTEL